MVVGVGVMGVVRGHGEGKARRRGGAGTMITPAHAHTRARTPAPRASHGRSRGGGGSLAAGRGECVAGGFGSFLWQLSHNGCGRRDCVRNALQPALFLVCVEAPMALSGA